MRAPDDSNPVLRLTRNSESRLHASVESIIASSRQVVNLVNFRVTEANRLIPGSLVSFLRSPTLQDAATDVGAMRLVLPTDLRRGAVGPLQGLAQPRPRSTDVQDAAAGGQ